MGDFNLDDFMGQMDQIKKLGDIGRVMKMIPGMGKLVSQFGMQSEDVEKQMDQMKAVYDSMTIQERHMPELINGSRRRRIARGAGVGIMGVSQFIKQFEMARDMMRAVRRWPR